MESKNPEMDWQMDLQTFEDFCKGRTEEDLNKLFLEWLTGPVALSRFKCKCGLNSDESDFDPEDRLHYNNDGKLTPCPYCFPGLYTNTK